MDDINSFSADLFQQPERVQIFSLKDKMIEIIIPSLIQGMGKIKKCALAV